MNTRGCIDSECICNYFESGCKVRRLFGLRVWLDYDGFAEQLAAIGRPIVVEFEATDNYHRTLAHRLLTAGFELRLISSVACPDARGAAQWLGQERPQGRAGHPAHAADRRDATLRRLARRGHQ